jgi:hypothetical protein
MEDTSPLRVVAIGGGSGLSALLQGLKHFARQTDVPAPALDVTAIVTVTDDGGSSGRLRREFDVLPPGDIRNCMVALSEDSRCSRGCFSIVLRPAAASRATASATSSSRRSPISWAIFRRRFASPPKCSRSPAESIPPRRRTSRWKLLWRTVQGNRRNTHQPQPSAHPARPIDPAQSATARGRSRRHRRSRCHHPRPGIAVYQRVAESAGGRRPAAIQRSPAVRAYFVNLMSQPGETTDFLASDHIRAIHQHAGRKFLDYAVVNIRPITLGGEETVRARRSQARRERYRRHSENGSQGNGRKLAQSGEKGAARTPRIRGRSDEPGAGKPDGAGRASHNR